MIDYTWKSKDATGNVRPPKQIRPQRDLRALLALVSQPVVQVWVGSLASDGYPFSQEQESTA